MEAPNAALGELLGLFGEEIENSTAAAVGTARADVSASIRDQPIDSMKCSKNDERTRKSGNAASLLQKRDAVTTVNAQFEQNNACDHSEHGTSSNNASFVNSPPDTAAAATAAITQNGLSTFVKKRKPKKTSADRGALQVKAQRAAKAVAESDAVGLYDAFFGIRVRNPVISSAAFEQYCDGLQKIRLSQLKPTAPKKWISLAVVVEKTGCRKSANGHEYIIWKAADLRSPQDPAVKILVFGDCVQRFWKMQSGTVIALISTCFADDSCKQVTLKVTKCAQVLEVGFCPDFGHCKAVKKDGGLCQNVVNLRQGELCIYHIQRAARKFTTNRGSFLSTSANANKVQRSNVTTGGVLTGPKRTARVPTNKLTINESRKNIKQLQQSGKSSKNSPADGKITTSNTSNGKETALLGTINGLQRYERNRENEEPLHDKTNESLKEFLQKQRENKTSVRSPILGRGLNSGSVLLRSPQKTVNRLNMTESAKQRAIAIIRNKGGLEKADPNSKPRKRLSLHPIECEESKMKKLKVVEKENVVENRGNLFPTPIKKYTDDEITALLKRKSNHEEDLRQEDTAREQRYFNAMEAKEKVENFLTTTMEIKNCSVVTCTQCRYTSHKQSDLCKHLGHPVKHHKADKRFFQCKQCHKRTAAYERMLAVPCPNCGDTNFERVAMKNERNVRLPQENLLLRGEERKFINC